MENGLKDETSRVQTDVKEALLWKRAQLAKELKELDATISNVQREYSLRLEQLLVQKKPLEDALYHVEALLQFEDPSVRNIQNVGRDRAKPVVAARHSVIDAVLDLLEERHQPMHYKDIAAKLQEINTYIPGKKPAATLLSRMNRDSRFKRTKKRGTYALSTWRGRDANAGNVKEFVSSTPEGKQVFLFKQPWSHISLFAFGVYGGG